jgi:flagellin
MALVINTNVASLNAQRQLMSSGNSLDRATERLSSGNRINSAKDDAAGLAISNRMTSQVRGLDQAIRNANDGVSLIQTAEGALQESTNILQRMRELAVQSANGIYTKGDRAVLDAENKQLVAELNRIAETTSFNGQKLLDGSLGKVDLQVGADANQTISLKVQAMDAKTLGMGSTSVDMMGAASSVATLTGAVELKENDVLINGQSIVRGSETFDGNADNLEDLVGYINKNVNGITASTVAQGTATSAGTGVLENGDQLQVTIGKLDGSSSTISVTNTQSLQELADKLNAESGGLLSASVGENGRLSITGNDVASLEFDALDSTGTAIASNGGDAILGTGLDTKTVNANIVLTADNDDPITITRGSTGTLGQLDALGFRENDKAGTIEGFTVGTAALAVGDLKINGVAIGKSETGGLQDKVNAINAVSGETGVTASVFSSAVLDFGGVSLATLVGGALTVNGHELTIPAGTATTSLGDLAKVFNDEADKTGIRASVSGTRLILEGNVAAINFGLDAGGTVGAADAFVDTSTVPALAQFSFGTDAAAAIANDTSIDGGIKLSSNNGNPISVEHKDSTAQTKTGLLDSNAATGGAFGAAISSISIDTQANAQKAIKVIDNALTTINDVRSNLGAVNNRLDFTVSNLANISEKTSAARSRITDADFAQETANLSRSQVLQQAATAMLAQSNARPQQVLSLLR